VALDLLIAQREAAFKQNDGDRERYQRKQQVTKQLLRFEPSHHGAGHNSTCQQKQNRWYPQAPGKPLAKQGEDTDAGKDKHNAD